MTVKDNILITIKNKIASPKAIPPLLPILLTILGEAASTTKNQKLRTKNYQALCASHSKTPTGYIPYGMISRKNKTGQKQVGQAGQWSIVSTISCHLSRYKAPVAGWS